MLKFLLYNIRIQITNTLIKLKLNQLTWDMVFSKPKDHSNIEGFTTGPDHHKIHPFDPNDQFSEESIAFWVKWADFYMWPHIIQYNR